MLEMMDARNGGLTRSRARLESSYQFFNWRCQLSLLCSRVLHNGVLLIAGACERVVSDAAESTEGSSTHLHLRPTLTTRRSLQLSRRSPHVSYPQL